MNRRSSGFTLVETLVVMALLGILATLGWMRLSRSTIRRAHATVALTNGMNEAKAIAANTGVDVIVTVDLEASILRIHADQNGDGEIAEDERVVEFDIDPYCATPSRECTRSLWGTPRGDVAVVGGERFTETHDGLPSLTIEGAVLPGGTPTP